MKNAFRSVSVFLAGLLLCAYALAADPVVEAEELARDTLREHCEGLLEARLNAARDGSWRRVINLGKNYADACGHADDRFAVSRAYEDIGWASLMLNDIETGLRYTQSCLDSNGLAAGCYARKAQLLFAKGKRNEARISANRGVSVAERAIGVTKIEIAQADKRRPDLRAEQYLRNRFLRLKDGLELRLDTLNESLALLTKIQTDLDTD